MSALKRQVAALDRQAAQLQGHLPSAKFAASPEWMESQRMLATSAKDVRDAIREGDLESACRSLMHGWMWWGKASVYVQLSGDARSHMIVDRARRDLLAAQSEYHRARAKTKRGT